MVEAWAPLDADLQLTRLRSGGDQEALTAPRPIPSPKLALQASDQDEITLISGMIEGDLRALIGLKPQGIEVKLTIAEPQLGIAPEVEALNGAILNAGPSWNTAALFTGSGPRAVEILDAGQRELTTPLFTQLSRSAVCWLDAAQAGPRLTDGGSRGAALGPLTRGVRHTGALQTLKLLWAALTAAQGRRAEVINAGLGAVAVALTLIELTAPLLTASQAQAVQIIQAEEGLLTALVQATDLHPRAVLISPTALSLKAAARQGIAESSLGAVTIREAGLRADRLLTDPRPQAVHVCLAKLSLKTEPLFTALGARAAQGEAGGGAATLQAEPIKVAVQGREAALRLRAAAFEAAAAAWAACVIYAGINAALCGAEPRSHAVFVSLAALRLQAEARLSTALPSRAGPRLTTGRDTAPLGANPARIAVRGRQTGRGLRAAALDAAASARALSVDLAGIGAEAA